MTIPNMAHLFGRITNSCPRNGVLRVGFGERGTVKDGHDSVFTPSLSQSQPCCGGMSNDISSNRLCGIFRKTHAIWIGHDLVGDKDGHSKFFRQTSELSQELPHLHLTFRKFSTTGIVRPVQCRGRIYHEQGIAILRHESRSHLEKFHLVLRVMRAGIGDVLQRYRWVHPEAFGNRLKTLGAKGTLRVDVDRFSFRSAFRNRKLAGHTQGMTELGLPCSELSKDFRNGSCFNPTLQEFIDFCRSRSQSQKVLSMLQGVGSTLELHWNHALDDILQLCDFGF
mmetsp:Transcript_59707/g.90022  ORF Transcript_59707/g.90022 Transcript_59707/m.90022 type:complete len:281 (+) Transcript_59707:189-1031(+)